MAKLGLAFGLVVALVLGCRDTGRLVPIAEPTRAFLVCDCSAPEPGLEISVISYIPNFNQVGQRIYGIDGQGNCSIITISVADLGREIFECSPHRNRYFDPDVSSVERIWPSICSEPQVVPRCLPLAEDGRQTSGWLTLISRASRSLRWPLDRSFHCRGSSRTREFSPSVNLEPT